MDTVRTSTVRLAAAVMSASLALAACSGDDGDDGPQDATPPATESATSPAPSEPAPGGTTAGDLANTDFAVAWTDAVAAAMENFDGDLVEIHVDRDDGRYAYDVDLVSRSEEYEVTIDAETGDQSDEETERIDADDVAEKRAEIIDTDAVVDPTEAMATALDARAGRVTEWTLEGDENGPRYEIDIDTDSGDDVEVTVDATTGELIDVDD